jgi:Ca2+/Na+ antiporter
MRPQIPEPDDRREGIVLPTAARPAAHALHGGGEHLLPWLGASMIVALATVGTIAFKGDITPIQTATLLVSLCATLTVAGLVAARAHEEVDATEREERARPARDQLQESADDPTSTRSYLQGMERWTIALLELIDHAAAVTSDNLLRDELTSASLDTDALRGLLQSSTARELNLNEAATLHSVCALWETNQDRIEQLAADIDPPWHRRWRARTLVERLLRHGPPQSNELVLPYRS